MRVILLVSLVSFLVIGTSFGAGASAWEDSENAPQATALDNYLTAKKELDLQASKGIVPHNYDIDDVFTYTDGPYPIYHDDGSPPGPNHMPWGSHYVSDVMYSPPNNPGGWNSMDATGGVGLFSVGDTHESWIGDQNGNGDLEWITGFSYRPWGEDGIDNDGDGCIDEKSFWQWDPSRGTNCDIIPDQVVYYETGGLPDAGGDDGDLLVNVDWYARAQSAKLWRAFVSPKWMAYELRGFLMYPQGAGDFFSYYAYEEMNNVNANPEMDNDMTDTYVGNIDARGFPARPPVDRACSAGYQLYMGITYKRDDGWVVTSHEFNEYFDNHDWNGDKDTDDDVAGYYAIDPTNGNCRENSVNTGVHGWYPRNTGVLLTPMLTQEGPDSRDWNRDGDTNDTLNLYHQIDTTWNLKGRVYTSVTFTYTVPRWGFGWTALYSAYAPTQPYPMEFGAAWYEYVGESNGYYHTFIALTGEEDGNRHSLLPKYDVSMGQPAGTPGGVCILIYVREFYMALAGTRLVGGIADANGDGDTQDTANLVFCPNETGGGGRFIVENTSKFAKGLYRDPIPFIELGYMYYSSDGTDSSGLCVLPFMYYEFYMDDDANGNLEVEFVFFHMYYWIDIINLVPGWVPGSPGRELGQELQDTGDSDHVGSRKSVVRTNYI